MKKKRFLRLLIPAAFSTLLVGGLKEAVGAKAVLAESKDEIDFVFSPRSGQPANIEVDSTYSAINVKYNGGTASCRSMVYANCMKSGDEYFDFSSIKDHARLEVLVYEGATTEHIQPFLVDKDGRTCTFGTTDDTSIAGSAYCESALDITSDANNKSPSGWAMNNNTQFSGTNYHGFPINQNGHAATAPDFVYYHLNFANYKYKSGYTEWASGLSLSPSGNNFDYSHVKLAGFWMNKIHQDEVASNWDIRVLEFSIRDTSTGARTVIFDASKAVATTSNSTLWNDRVDSNGNSYVYIWSNPTIASNITLEVKHDFKIRTTAQTRQIKSFNNGTITIKGNTGDAWLWAFAKDYNRFAPMDCTGFDGTIWHINNTTGSPLKMDWYLIYNGNNILNKMFLFPDNGDDSEIDNPVTTVIPAGFCGWVYSLFEQNNTVKNNLANLTNTTRLVLTATADNLNKSFEVSCFKLVKNAAALRDAKQAARATLTTYAELDNYRETEKASVLSAIEDGVKAAYSAATTTAIDQAIADAKLAIDSAKDGLKTDAEYDAEEAFAALNTKAQLSVSYSTKDDGQGGTKYEIVKNCGKNEIALSFGTFLTASLKKSLDGFGATEYGIAYKIGDGEFVHKALTGAFVANAGDAVAIEESLDEAVANSHTYQYMVTLKNIPTAAFDTLVTAKAYVLKDTTYTYAQETVHSVNTIAQAYVDAAGSSYANHMGMLTWLAGYNG